MEEKPQTSYLFEFYVARTPCKLRLTLGLQPLMGRRNLLHEHSKARARRFTLLQNYQLGHQRGHARHGYEGCPESCENIPGVVIPGIDEMISVPEALDENANSEELHDTNLHGTEVGNSSV